MLCAGIPSPPSPLLTFRRLTCPRINANGPLDMNLKAVSGVVIFEIFEDSQPVACAVVYRPVDDNLGTLLEILIEAALVRPIDRIACFHTVNSPVVAGALAPGVPMYREVIDNKPRSYITQVIYIFTWVKLDLPTVAIYCVGDKYGRRLAAFRWIIGDTVQWVLVVEGDAGKQVAARTETRIRARAIHSAATMRAVPHLLSCQTHILLRDVG